MPELSTLNPNQKADLETQLALPLRPGTGAAGKGIRLYANYFQVGGSTVALTWV